MPSLNVGCDFSEKHIDTIESLIHTGLQEHTPSRIKAVYGSPKTANPFGSVRSSFREQESELTEFKDRCIRLIKKDVKICLTLNSLFPHIKNYGLDVNVFDNQSTRNRLSEFYYAIKDTVDYWIIAHPFLVELFLERFSDAKVIVSTIMNVHHWAQLDWITENWPNVKVVCPALWRNRDFDWLEVANSIIPLELLANEFCSMGGVSCEGLFRQACYLTQSMETLDGWNPLLRCIEERNKHPEAWLMARFILPQWLNYYQSKLKISKFKITGRTHSWEYIADISLRYMREHADGNLLELWGQLQATLDKDKGNWSMQQAMAISQVNIPIEKVVSMIKIFENCWSDKCGYTCMACKEYYSKISGKEEDG